MNCDNNIMNCDDNIMNCDNNTSFKELKEQLEYCSNLKNFYLKKSNECIKNEKKITELLKSKCNHKNTENHKDSGPYPESHIFCKDCEMYL